MFDREYSSMEQIDKTFYAHLESLRLSGIPFDETGILSEWATALRNFQEKNLLPPWHDARF